MDAAKKRQPLANRLAAEERLRTFDDENKYRRYSKIVNPSRKQKHSTFSVNNFNFCATVVTSLLLVATVTLFIVLNLHHVENEEIELTTQETRLIIPNTYLYNYLEIFDRSSRIHTFFYERFPPLTNSIWIEKNETVEIGENTFKYWARYLNEGSSVKINWSMDEIASLFVIRGTFAFNKWVEHSGGQNYLKFNQDAKGSLEFQISDSDDYFFVLENPQKVTIHGAISLNLSTTVFDTSKATGFFDGSFRMDFPFGSEQYLVLANPSKLHSQSVVISLSSSRMTLLFFLAFSIQFLFLCSCVIWRLSTPPKRERNDRSFAV